VFAKVAKGSETIDVEVVCRRRNAAAVFSKSLLEILLARSANVFQIFCA
jgi:hypothetical protein